MKNKLYYLIALCIMQWSVSSCADDKFDMQPELPSVETGGNTDTETDEPTSGYDEQYRPLIHFTPAKNWMNDPNGMVYMDGVYHLFYQYNPQANDWGNLSWGHATSTDLIRWEE